MNPGASPFPVAYWRLSSAARVQPCGPGQPAEPAPARRSAGRTSEATISMPSTESGKAWARQPAWPWSWASWRIWL